jgi:hypothetical protein
MENREHVGWRARCLVGGGFENEEARRLAADERIDIHALLELVDRGCPPHLAARILAPLEDEATVTPGGGADAALS